MVVQGVIVTLNTGYGFLRAEGKPDHFFYGGSLAEPGDTAWSDLEVGDQVEFESVSTARGWRAEHVRVVSKRTPVEVD